MNRRDHERLRRAAVTSAGSSSPGAGSGWGLVVRGDADGDADAGRRRTCARWYRSWSSRRGPRHQVRARWTEPGGRRSRCGTPLWLLGLVEPTLRGATAVDLEVRRAGTWVRTMRLLVIALAAAVVVVIAVGVLVTPIVLVLLVYLAVLGVNLAIMSSSHPDERRVPPPSGSPRAWGCLRP